MKSPIHVALLIAGAILTAPPAVAQLKLVQHFEVPGDSEKFDHFEATPDCRDQSHG